MIQGEILDEKSLNLAELQEEIDAIKKRDEELGFRSAKTEEYLQVVSKLDIKKAKELFEKIEKLGIPRLKDAHINKIIDVLPKTIDDMQVIFQGYPISITQDNMKKVLDVVKAY